MGRDGTLSMRPLTARIVYSLCLCSLAACAALPEPVTTAGQAHASSTTASHPSGIAADLAAAMRRQAELTQVYGSTHPETAKAAAAASSLRESGLLADPQTFERNLVEALSYQLANARHDVSVLSALYGENHPEVAKTDGVVLALTVAINTEVRRIKSVT
jgi:uncharacterized protein involved in exopolysaccharide biosynthesis